MATEANVPPNDTVDIMREVIAIVTAPFRAVRRLLDSVPMDDEKPTSFDWLGAWSGQLPTRRFKSTAPPTTPTH